VHVKLRSTITKAALVLATTALTLLAVEGVLRAVYTLPPGHAEQWRTDRLLPVDDPKLQFVNRPRAGDDPVGPEGFRGIAPPRERRPGVPRIFVLGDSVTFGTGVAPTRTYSARLEALLAERLGGPVEVINAGVPGYDIVQVAALYRRRVRDFTPDIVVYGFFHNDLEARRSLILDTDPPTVVGVMPADSMLPGEIILPGGVHEALTRSSFLYNWLNLALLKLTGESWEFSTSMNEQLRSRGVRAMERLSAAATEDRTTLLVALLPTVVRRDPERCGDPLVPITRQLLGYCAYNDHVLDFVAGVCANLGVTTLDLRHAYETLPGQSLAMAAGDPDHPDPEGHRLLAEALLPHVLAHLEPLPAAPTAEGEPP